MSHGAAGFFTTNTAEDLDRMFRWPIRQIANGEKQKESFAPIKPIAKSSV